MGKINLIEVTKDNLYEICKLSNTLNETQGKFVATNSYSIAQAHYYPESAWFRGIYLDETPIGFVMVDVVMDDSPEEEKPSVMLWRFMIGREHQGKGYAKKVIDILSEKFSNEGKKYFYTSCGLGEGGPYDFYIKQGFIDTGIMDGDEQLLKRDLQCSETA
jgi:diamine N-acetyltransferase